MLQNHLFSILIILVCELPSAYPQSGGDWFVRVAVEPEIELCGSTKFYCPSRRLCVPREERCVIENIEKNACPDQAKCYSVSWNPSNLTGIDRLDEETEDRFFVYRAYSTILESGSSGGRRAKRTGRERRSVKQALRTLMFDPWKHSFVQYRGFVYEFGKYGVQELDLNDPDYKYDREWTAAWEIVAVSKCTREHLWHFIRNWNYLRGKYLWYANNCHHFTNAFIKYLGSDCSNELDALVLEKTVQ